MKPVARLPPQDLKAEAAFLAALLRDPEKVEDSASTVTAEMFYADEYRDVFSAVLELRTARKPVDQVTLGAHMALMGSGQRDPSETLSSLEAVPDTSNPEAYAAIIVDCWQRRLAIAAAQSVIDESYASPATDVLDRASFRFAELASCRHTSVASSAADALGDALVSVDDRTTPAGLTTGLKTLDDVFWHRNGELTILAARPGLGKTARSVENAACIAMNGDPALVFSLEMQKPQVALRLGCQLANVNLSKVLAKQHTFEERARLADARSQMAQWPLYIDDTAAIRISEVRAKARKLDRELAKRKKRLRFIVVDYLQLMGGMDENDTRDQGIGATTRALKQLAKEMDLPVLVLSQLTRSAEDTTDKRPSLRHLRESGSIEADADNVLFIYRDEMANRGSKLKGLAEIIVAKQRSGPAGGSYHFAFSGETTSFRDLTDKERLAYGLPKLA